MSLGRYIVVAFVIAWCIGIFSALYIYSIDLDHPYCLLRDNIVITWEALSRQACRDWHFPIGAGTWIFTGLAFTYATGRAIVRMTRKR